MYYNCGPRLRWRPASRRAFGRLVISWTCWKHGKWLKGSGPLKRCVMSHPYINDPKYWRERAEEARSIARLLNDLEAKRHMLAIAARYDRLAEHVKSRKFKMERKA